MVRFTQELGGNWIRLNGVSWRSVQPNEGGPYNWSALATFEAQLGAAVRAHLTPIIVIKDSPGWATGNPKTCAAVQSQHFHAFADFVRALARRYKHDLPYNIDYWEIANEPDVDPNLAPLNSLYGCWGDVNDPYYGGEHYGDMLKVVTPAIKRANPSAKVITGGLLLNAPKTTAGGWGHPENFLEGILKSGAAPYFDIIGYHDYQFYSGQPENIYLRSEVWAKYGGMSIGKPTFLRQVMARYDVDKPLMLNETAFLCYDTPPHGMCNSKNATPEFMQAFFELQADTVAPLLVRALGEKVEAVLWYNLDTSWLNSNLISGSPRPAYRAYQTLIQQTGWSQQFPSRIDDYGSRVEAYRFIVIDYLVDVVWSPDRTAQQFHVPEDEFVAAYTRDGDKITPLINDGYVEIDVTTSAVYIHRTQ